MPSTTKIDRRIAPSTSCLNPEKLREHLYRLNLPDEGISYVVSVATSPPSRSVGEHRNRNLIVDMPVPRLGVVLQCESASGEYFFLLNVSRQRDVLAIYDQPQPVFLTITTRKGIKTPAQHTPDFLVVYADRVVTYEVKSDEKLKQLCQSRPVDWQFGDSGYCYLPAMKHFERLGISHSTVPNSVISAVRAENLRLLASVRMRPDTQKFIALRNRVLEIVEKENVIRLDELMARIKTTDTTAIYQLIDEDKLCADLDQTFLTSLRNVWISKSLSLIRELQPSRLKILDTLKSSEQVNTSEVPHPKYLGEIALRYALCKSNNANLIAESQRSARSLRRYRSKYLASRGDLRALFPRWERCGNTSLRKCKAHYDLLHDVMREMRKNPNLPSAAVAYREYQTRLKQDPILRNEHPFARPTAYRHWHLTANLSEDDRAKGGRRLANAEARSIDPSHRTLVPTRAYSNAHIDHYLADIELVLCSDAEVASTQRPWISAMVDAYTGEVLALWVSFRAPCRESCAMLLRDCVRRHQRLPELIVVDGGKEFDSTHFVVTLATLGITRANRPPEDPRFGKEVERVYGQFKECFARGLPGFVTGPMSARKTSGAFSSGRRARLTLEDLMESLEEYVFNGYNCSPRPQSMESRKSLREQSLALYPFSGIAVELNKSFLILTSIEAPSASYMLSSKRGVHVLGRWYFNPILADYKGFKKNVSVRIDPFDSSVVYVCVQELWHVCYSTDKVIHAAMSEFDVISKTAKHQQLRAARYLAADEAARYAYERKMEPIKLALQSPMKAKVNAGAMEAPIRQIDRQRRKKDRKIDEIGDLPMDGDFS